MEIFTQNTSHVLIAGGESDPFLDALLPAINQATEIAVAVAFIRQSGLDLLFDALVDAMDRHAVMRVLTSDYLEVTEPQALRRLMLLAERGADIRLFTTAGNPSFHIKSYLFLRRAGETLQNALAFVGSSNISRIALTHGLEWNLKISYPEESDKFLEIYRKFNRLFNDSHVVSLSHSWIDHYVSRRKVLLRVVQEEHGEETRPVAPNEIQQEALAALQGARENGYKRGLVVLATGLGKTWLAAFDAKQSRAERVLFVAHREEILIQAEDTFVRIWPDAKLGYYKGNQKELDADFLFASIQSLGKAVHLRHFSPEYFDYIIIDEFHHADATTYRRLINYFEPKFLLGLTATPERTDQADILSLCDNNLVFERNFVAGINAGLLCPFHYYGILDETVRYEEIPWRNRRFDPNELSHKLATRARAKHAFKIWQKQHQKRTLAFCVSQQHADFMASYFSKEGVKAAAVHTKSALPRNAALSQLRNGQLEVIFSVDLFNEGIDLPSIDTVMMLRPTESKILFLQQLGRGLRLEEKKNYLQVLDFIGNHKSFLNKPEALFGLHSSREFIKRQRNGLLPLPKGCYANYDLGVIEFFEQVTRTVSSEIVDTYDQLLATNQQRPTAAKMYYADIAFKNIRGKFGSWFALVKHREGLDDIGQAVFNNHSRFFLEIETTSMTKSFKMVLLQAILELDGFIHPQSVDDLANLSARILMRYPTLVALDLPEEYRNLGDSSVNKRKQWAAYWMRNPVKALIGGNTTTGEPFFSLRGDRLKANFTLSVKQSHPFELMLQELIDYRLAQYIDGKPATSGREVKSVIVAKQEVKKGWKKIRFFPDLQIACGHFRQAYHENDVMIDIAPKYRIDLTQHFIASASGNSMNGGKKPICDGDYLLLEWIDVEHAGSISNQILAIERWDEDGENQYLLRWVRKREADEYYLQANNMDYADFDATAQMNTFARLCKVIPTEDLVFNESQPE